MNLDTEFVNSIHKALKRLHREGELGRHPLTQLLAVEAQRCQHGWPDTALGRASALRHTLEAARQAMAEQTLTSAVLLTHRFWLNESITKIAQRQNLAPSTLYSRQKRAIKALAHALWALEQKAQTQLVRRQRRLTRNVPPPAYTHIFGREQALEQLQALLTDPNGPWLISIEGLGGIGKTTLAQHLVSWASQNSKGLADIAWITAQQHKFTTWSGIVERRGAVAPLTFAALLKQVAQQFGYTNTQSVPQSEKLQRLKTALKQAPHLVVIDNLDAAADQDRLASQLWGLVNPSRFLLTSRHSLGHHDRVFCLRLDELDQNDSQNLMRYEGERRGIHTIAQAQDTTLGQIYASTGGHPLAIKLVVGHARNLPLERALLCLQEPSCQQTDQLYQFIYKKSWEMLSDAAKKVLLAMPSLTQDDGRWENLLAASDLSGDELEQAVQELVGMSLLSASGLQTQYSIHQLTYTFIISQLLADWTA